MEELIKFKKRGQKAAVVFIIMREDADFFSPNDEMDSVFGNTLRKAKNSGVEVYAYKCSINQKGISYGGKIPVRLDLL
ncbi:MAG: sugar fermentation stimulation protein [Clostridia bacterium]|nr:sugar fermentation stimulation protein [Clostridia bacterium]MDN5322122.1 sugar fermentation stimulation protein [Clostridia bacterium]